MTLLPDPTELDAVAARIAEHARVTRARAHRLGLASTGVAWHGAAARAFELTAEDTVHALRLAADRLDDAAHALRRHAGTVRGVLDGLRALSLATGVLATELADGVRDGVLAPDRLLDDAGGLLDDARHLAADAGHLLTEPGHLVAGAGRLVGVG